MKTNDSLPEITHLGAEEFLTEDIDFLLEDFIMLGLVGLVGQPGCGKSTFTTWAAAQVSLGRWGARRDVLMVSLEERIGMAIKPRLIAAGADMAHVFFPNPGEPELTFPRDLPRLARYLNRHRPALVVLDSAQELIPKVTRDTREVMRSLKDMSHALGCCVLCITHFNRSGRTVQTAIYGSSAFYQSFRSILHFDRMPDGFVKDKEGNERVLAVEKNNLIATPNPLRFNLRLHEVPGIKRGIPSFAMDGDIPDGPTSAEVFAFNLPKSEKVTKHQRQLAIEFLRHHLAEGEKRQVDVVEAGKTAGLSEKTLRRAARDIDVSFSKHGPPTPTTSWWSLPVPVVPDSLPPEFDG